VGFYLLFLLFMFYLYLILLDNNPLSEFSRIPPI
jgi:hypothetical protein